MLQVLKKLNLIIFQTNTYNKHVKPRKESFSKCEPVFALMPRNVFENGWWHN